MACALLSLATAALVTSARWPDRAKHHAAVRAIRTNTPIAHAALSHQTNTASLLGVQDELLVLKSAPGAAPSPGQVFTINAKGAAPKGRAVVLFERCGLTFAAQLDGPPAALDDVASESDERLAAADGGDAWAGAFDHLGAPLGAPLGATAVSPTPPLVFGAIVPQAERAPISKPLHTGVVAIDALAPLGRGQSMLLLGPDGLPAELSRSAVARRVLGGSAAFAPEVSTVLVMRVPAGGAPAAYDSLRGAPWLASTKVLLAEGDVELLLAAQAACSYAEARGGDSLVVVDSLAPLLRLWRSAEAALAAQQIVVRAEEEGSQLRAFYALLTERANRRKGGSTTLLLLQPSASVRAAAESAKEAYELDDFVEAGFSQTALKRLGVLVSKGVPLTPSTLEKLSIPAPGSGHPRAEGGRRAGQHTEELTSLSDGHIELSETLASVGRQPPVDPAQSLTRIGVGTTALRPAATTKAMRLVTRALRLELASAADPVHCETAQRTRAAACAACLHQPEAAPMPLGEQVALLLAATGGLLDGAVGDVQPEALNGLVSRLRAHLRAQVPQVLEKVTSTGRLTDEQSDELRRSVRDFES